jgi:diacylglycerol kinase family enzyme
MTGTTTSPFGPIAVIVDPEAGDGKVRSQVDHVAPTIAGLGFDHSVEIAASSDDVTRLTTEALDRGVRYIAAVGDDRTVQDVVNGMFRDGRPIAEEAVLAVLPASSGCDLVKSFGLPGDLAGAARHLEGEEVYRFDVFKIAVTGPHGEIVTRYAHNVAEIGLHGAAWRARERLPRRLGRARRFLGFWWAYLTNGVREVSVSTDTRTKQHRAWSIVVGNGQFSDGGLRISPRSFPGDGVLEALVFTGPKAGAYRSLPRVFKHGDHVPDPDIAELRAKLVLKIDADRPMPVVADGRYLGTTPAAFQVVPGQILLKV